MATPLESMNSRSVKSTTNPRAEVGTAWAMRSPVRDAPAMSSSPVTRATTTSSRSSMSIPTSPSLNRGPLPLESPLQPNRRALRRGRDVNAIHQRAHERQAAPLVATPWRPPSAEVANGDLHFAAPVPAAHLERRPTTGAGMLDRIRRRLPAGGGDLRDLLVVRPHVTQPAPQQPAHRGERLGVVRKAHPEVVRHPH